MRFIRLLLSSLAAVTALSAQPIPGRYIVELADPPAGVLQAEIMRRQPGRRAAEVSASREVSARRAAIRTAQQRMTRRIAARGGRVLDTVDTTLNALFVAIDDAAAARLRQLPGVLRVTQERRFQARLDRVLTLSNVPAAWEKLGGVANAGLGVGIAILDSGVDSRHPGFQDDTLSPPQGFPKASSAANEKFLTKKVIVARSYEDLSGPAYGADAADKNGHGTNAGCAAACVVHNTNNGVIAGAAPKAFLGAYKVLGNDGGGSESAILKGIDDAVKDGFDVLNLSLGSDLPGDPEKDAQVKALQTAADAGYIVAVAAGNAGPDENTINSPGTAEKVITVGSSSSDRELTDSGRTPIDPNRLSGFSSRGPNPGPALKPDLAAVGDNFFTAASTEKNPEVFYTITQGTSFATPTVAGAAATLKGARPGLTAAQYRSLLINSASEIRHASGVPAPIRHQGAGRLDLAAAFDMPIAFAPTSVKFGAGGATAEFTREIVISNLLDEAVPVELSVRSFDERRPAEIQGPASLALPAKGAATVTLRFAGAGLAGEYHGVLLAKNGKNGVEGRVPYWYGVRSDAPQAITLLEFKGQGAAGASTVFYARVVDAVGLDATGAQLTVATDTPGAKVSAVVSIDAERPGVFAVEVLLAPGENSFVLSAGGAQRTVQLTGN